MKIAKKLIVNCFQTSFHRKKYLCQQKFNANTNATKIQSFFRMSFARSIFLNVKKNIAKDSQEFKDFVDGHSYLEDMNMDEYFMIVDEFLLNCNPNEFLINLKLKPLSPESSMQFYAHSAGILAQQRNVFTIEENFEEESSSISVEHLLNFTSDSKKECVQSMIDTNEIYQEFEEKDDEDEEMEILENEKSDENQNECSKNTRWQKLMKKFAPKKNKKKQARLYKKRRNRRKL